MGTKSKEQIGKEVTTTPATSVPPVPHRMPRNKQRLPPFPCVARRCGSSTVSFQNVALVLENFVVVCVRHSCRLRGCSPPRYASIGRFTRPLRCSATIFNQTLFSLLAKQRFGDLPAAHAFSCLATSDAVPGCSITRFRLQSPRRANGTGFASRVCAYVRDLLPAPLEEARLMCSEAPSLINASNPRNC